MKLNFEFAQLLGAVYRKGNLLFSTDGNSVISPVGNRISVFDLKNSKTRTLKGCKEDKDVVCVGCMDLLFYGTIQDSWRAVSEATT